MKSAQTQIEQRDKEPMMANYRKKIAMNLFVNTSDLERNQPQLDPDWGGVDIISANCPVHTGVKLQKTGDNQYQCPKGREIYKAKSSIANQTSKDRYDIGISIK